MDNLEIYEKSRCVPDGAKRKITGGRMNGKTDINPMWRIKKLTELFGPCGVGWYYKSVNKWTETYGDEIACFVDIELYIKVDGEWSMPIYGTGGNMFVKQESRGANVSDECYKMATTDAISVACKQLGIGADVYWSEDTTKYAHTTPKQEIPERIIPVYKELNRIGYSVSTVLKTYKLNDINDITDLQIKDFLSKVKNMQDKPA